MVERKGSERSKGGRRGKKGPAPGPARPKSTSASKATRKRPSEELRTEARRPATLEAKSASAASASAGPASAASAELREPLCPVVGIGASAGGLEALDIFLKHVPPKSGMAFVVVQHLDPTHKGALIELLRRASEMPITQVEDSQPVEPDHVYVIPPGKDMSILHGVLHLLPMMSPRGLNLPIDFFFRSLAADRQEGSIGVVLSGMGSDGTLGLRSIKENGGATFVQSLTSAKFDGMPRSAIDAGVADIVAPVDELPGRIVAYSKRASYITKPELSEPARKHESAFEKVLILLRAQSGNDFSLYKRSTVERRIERRMNLHQLDKMADYVRFLRENPRETEFLFKELLIGVTSFFRDPEAWEQLRKDVVPDLLKARAQGGPMRAWVPACSTGEEAYSLAIVLTEAIEEDKSAHNVSGQIFATDLDKDAVEKARQGFYPENIAADVSPARLRRFFVKDEHGYRVRKEIREMVVFAPQNVITDPPFTKLDIVSCRNLLIYLSAELQKKLIPLFHYSLLPGGVLFLGSAETVGGFTTLFSPLEGKSRLYRRLDTPLAASAVEFPSAFVNKERGALEPSSELAEVARAPSPNLQILADRVIVQRFAPAAVLTSEKGDILYLSTRTGKYLEPVVGKANLNIFSMAREGLRVELSNAFAAALREEKAILRSGLKVRTNGTAQVVDLRVQKLLEPKELRGTVMIVISDVAEVAAAQAPPSKARRTPARTRLGELEAALFQAREEAQTVREEMQTSQEELKSTNEELQSTNEELQSTNEELTTSKEEMQSMNEELQTVNQELQSKIDDLARSNNDMRNLLNSTDVATLFLDSELRVRRFTTPTTKIIKLIPADAGRPITDFATELDYPALADDAHQVLQTLAFKDTQVAARNGHWYTVRIMPYRTLENVIDGVVITFTDYTSAKEVESMLSEQAGQLKQMAESLPNLVWGCRPDGACDFLSRQWIEYTGFAEEGQLGLGWMNQVHPDDRGHLEDEWRTAVREGAPLNTEIRIRSKGGAFRWFKTRAIPIRNEQNVVVKWYGTHTDIDDLKGAQGAAVRLKRIRDWLLEGALDVDDELTVTSANQAATRMLGMERGELVGRSFSELLPDGDVRQRVLAALESRTDVSFDAPIGREPKATVFSIVALPGEQGITVLFRPTDARVQGAGHWGGGAGVTREEEAD